MASKILAIQRFELSILAMFARCSNRLSYTALNFTLLSFRLCTIIFIKWHQITLAIVKFELLIFALLARLSNRLSYMALQLALFSALVFEQYQIK